MWKIWEEKFYMRNKHQKILNKFQRKINQQIFSTKPKVEEIFINLSQFIVIIL